MDQELIKELSPLFERKIGQGGVMSTGTNDHFIIVAVYPDNGVNPGRVVLDFKTKEMPKEATVSIPFITGKKFILHMVNCALEITKLQLPLR